MEYFGIKDLYDVRIKCIRPMTIRGKEYKAGQVIFRFNKIQIGDMKETKARVSARGGKKNTRLISWEDTKEVYFSATEGVLTKMSLAILSNSKLADKIDGTTETISTSQELESNASGVITLKYPPVGDLYIYNENGEEITDYTVSGNAVNIGSPFTEVVVDYQFEYEDKSSTLTVGNRMINGYVCLEGKTRYTDDMDGKAKTCLITFPHVRLLSELSVKLGKDMGIPNTYFFNFSGEPVTENGETFVCKMKYLDTDLDSDF